MSHYQNSPTFRLFGSNPSFMKGVARVFDFSQSLDKYNTSPTTEEADFNAIKSDWEAVGKDIRVAIEKYGERQNSGK
ncbi:MAG: hypothetical protein IPJ68_04485 [Candidatus Moraniibacteriota bacterium]|nr:MAG: hypothetical protein IPJ68_04485 [Candidatus Moranbacteria bacterium]